MSGRRGGRGGGSVGHIQKICASDLCSNVLARKTAGEYCYKCFQKHPRTAVNNNETEDNPLVGFDNIQQLYEAIGFDDGPIGQRKTPDVVTLIRKEVAPLVEVIKDLLNRVKFLETKVGKIDEELDDMGEKLKTASENNETFKRIILEQQKYLESMKRRELSTNIIVSGIPNEPVKINGGQEATDDKEKINLVFNHINCTNELKSDIKIISLPIRESSTTHSVKMQLSSSEDVKTVISSAKRLKTFKDMKVYINYDEPYHSRRENNRLRKRKSDLKRMHINDDIKISKGKLYHNEMIVDQFDISHQLF